jgi:abhydrolase domain-containing protein 17
MRNSFKNSPQHSTAAKNKMGGNISSLVFQPPELSYANAKRPLIWLRTVQDSQIPAFYLDRQAKITFLFSHGNAEDLGLIFEWFVFLSNELKVNVLAYEYDGYGKSVASGHEFERSGHFETRGTPNEQACYDDIYAAYDYLVNELHQLPENIILYGRSLGSGPTVFLANKLSNQNIRLGGIILQSPITSIYRVLIPFRWTFPGDKFPSLDRIGGVVAPVFVIHGTKDEIVPFQHGEEIFFSTKVEYRAKPLWIDGGGHNNLETFL